MYAVDHPEIAQAVVRPALRRPVLTRGRAIVRRFLAAIVAGSDHPMWATPDSRDRAALLPRSRYDRLLNEGRVQERR